jgi:integrase
MTGNNRRRGPPGLPADYVAPSRGALYEIAKRTDEFFERKVEDGTRHREMQRKGVAHQNRTPPACGPRRDKGSSMPRSPPSPRIAAVLDFSRASGYRQGENPADAKLIGKLLPQRTKVQPVEHFAAVPYGELPAFVATLRQRHGSAARALEFLILTAARTNEALGIRWSEIDFANRLWIVPPERMKAHREHRQPLSDAAIDLLHRLPGREDGNDLVFISSQPGKPLSAESLLRVLRRMGRLTESVHGFRSTFSDWCHERTAHSPREIELSLAHSIGSAVEQAYRRTDLLERRRQLMESWGNYCASPPREAETGETVVPMRSPR